MRRDEDTENTRNDEEPLATFYVAAALRAPESGPVAHDNATPAEKPMTDTTPTFPPKLAAALAKAQRAMKAAEKDRTNPHFQSKYATLASVWEAVREPYGAVGIGFVQHASTTAAGVKVVTVMAHESGESVSSEIELPVLQKTPQGYGSAFTYARRYGLSAMAGVVADEDDDGNAASAKPSTGVADVAAALKASAAKKAPAKPSTDESGVPS